MRLIIGLGNPGIKYKKTRHNVGFMCVDESVGIKKETFILDKQKRVFIATININGKKNIIIKPQTFMNLSGEAVKTIMDYYDIAVEDILVIYDDMDLPLGKIRVRKDGSAGGHKGMKNIIDILKTQQIKRVRIGIDKKEDVIDFVLGNFSKDEKITIELAIAKVVNIIDDFSALDFDTLMNKYNGG